MTADGPRPPSNWAGNYTYRADAVHMPRSLDELRDLVARLPSVRVLGSRHSFTAIADAQALVSLDCLPVEIDVDPNASTVRVGGAVRYGELAAELERHGLALANLASLPHIAVAGSVATATHGSGERNGNLATSVRGLELVTSDGEVVRTTRGERDFQGMVVALGSLGAVTQVTLDVEPAYEVAQHVFNSLPWERLFEHFDEIMAAGYSVSAFTRWGDAVEQVWVKCRLDRDREPPGDELFGAIAAGADQHPIAGLDPVNCTPQLAVPGSWSARLPHFRMGFTPSSGAEIQSEYIVPRRHAVEALQAVCRLARSVNPLTQVSEIRAVARDELWLSPQYGQDTAAIHFTWKRDQAAVERVLERIEDALAPFGARPHWGKLFLAGADTLAPLYPRSRDFGALLERLDPRGAFRNRWLERHLLGGRRGRPERRGRDKME